MRIIPSKAPIIVGADKQEIAGSIGVDRSRRRPPSVVLTLTDDATGQKFDIIAGADESVQLGLAAISLGTSLANGNTPPPIVELRESPSRDMSPAALAQRLAAAYPAPSTDEDDRPVVKK
jgi:hypothetical protein